MGEVSETAIVFLHLFALLLCSAVSYSSYIFTFTVMNFSLETAAKMDGTEIFLGVTFSVMSLSGAFGALALIYRLGWRYHASPLGRFIARLSGIRFISYVHRKYWLPSGHSLRPRPRFFYLKRFIVRQSEFFCHFPTSRLLYYVSCRR